MSDIWNERIILSPSLISCCDLCALTDSVQLMESKGIKSLHVDILDGHFSPSMPIGLDTVRQLRKRTSMVFDVHVMTSSNEFFVDELIDMGVDQIVFHGEAEKHLDYQLNKIHSAGLRAGVALKPGTSLTVLDYVIDKCDAVLLMLINPGYAQNKSEGQVPYAMRKLNDLHDMISSRGLNTRVIIDGRISKQNLEYCIPSGLADTFVLGSTCLDKNNLATSIDGFKHFVDSLTAKM